MHQPDHTMFATPGLSPLEWRVVMLARAEADRLRCWASNSAAPGRLRRMLSAITGIESGIRRLADERLETLRQFVCSVRRGDRAVEMLGATLLTLGFAPEALRQATELARA